MRRIVNTLPYQVSEERIRSFLERHPEVSLLGTNVPISESNFTIPLLYGEEESPRAVYIEDEEWDEERIQRLMEWILALRFFSDYRGVPVEFDGSPAPDVAEEIVSLEPVVIAKLAAVLSLVMVDSETPQALVEVAEQWLKDLFAVTLPEAGEVNEDGLNLDQTALMLDHMIEHYFWSQDSWHFHPLEYVLLLGAAFGEIVRRKYGGRWEPGEHPLEARLQIGERFLFSPFQAVLLMLEKGPDASLWETYQLIPIELEGEDAGEPGVQ